MDTPKPEDILFAKIAARAARVADVRLEANANENGCIVIDNADGSRYEHVLKNSDFACIGILPCGAIRGMIEDFGIKSLAEIDPSSEIRSLIMPDGGEIWLSKKGRRRYHLEPGNYLLFTFGDSNLILIEDATEEDED